VPAPQPDLHEPRVEGHCVVVDQVLRPMTRDEQRAATDWVNRPDGHGGWRRLR